MLNKTAPTLPMKYLHPKKIMSFLYNKLTGSFAGFVIGMAATGLVSRFFETRSIKNLWGLTAKKKIIDKGTYGHMEWLISIIIGFIVFEIVTKVVKQKIDTHFPKYKYRVFRWAIRNGVVSKSKEVLSVFNEKKITFFSGMQMGTKNAIRTFSKK